MFYIISDNYCVLCYIVLYQVIITCYIFYIILDNYCVLCYIVLYQIIIIYYIFILYQIMSFSCSNHNLFALYFIYNFYS